MMGFPKQGPVVAIDGPAGTGKSSVTRRLATLLGFIHVDTGALYRAIAVLAGEKGLLAGKAKLLDFSEDEQAVLADLARTTHLEFKRIEDRDPANRIFANGTDLTDRIRTPEVSMGASLVSSLPGVRSALLGLQRKLGCAGRTILEGRDIGTVIFPDADVKFFLTANVEERAKRRWIELEAAGSDTPSFEEIKKQITDRDRADSTRATAPLKKADGALEIDTSNLTLDQVVSKMESLIRQRIGT